MKVSDNGYNIFNETKYENIKYTFNYILHVKSYFIDIKDRIYNRKYDFYLNITTLL